MLTYLLSNLIVGTILRRWQKAQKAELNLIGWGSSYGAIHEAIELLQKEGIVANHVHLSEIWPFPTEAVSRALNNKAKSIVIESNATAQMASLIRRETGIKVSGNILRYDGRPISPKHVIGHLKFSWQLFLLLTEYAHT